MKYWLPLTALALFCCLAAGCNCGTDPHKFVVSPDASLSRYAVYVDVVGVKGEDEASAVVNADPKRWWDTGQNAHELRSALLKEGRVWTQAFTGSAVSFDVTEKEWQKWKATNMTHVVVLAWGRSDQSAGGQASATPFKYPRSKKLPLSAWKDVKWEEEGVVKIRIFPDNIIVNPPPPGSN